MQISARGFALNTNYQRHQSMLATSMGRLASGDRFSKLGVDPAATLSKSQRMRHLIRAADASIPAIQTASNYLQTADSYLGIAESILERMAELAAVSVDGLKSTEDRAPLEQEFQALKSELTGMARSTRFDHRQVVGRDALVSFDANTDRVKFWLPDGLGASEIERDFGANAIDAVGTEIGFDSSEDFSMSRDGRSLYFLGTVTGDPGGAVRLKRYDLVNHVVTTGTDLFATGDKLFVDEDGDLTVNGAGTLYTMDPWSLGRTATAVTDITVGTEYSIYKDEIVYHRSSDNNVVQVNLGSMATSVLTGPFAFGAGVDNAVSASGNYMADESVAGQIRVIDTRTGSTATFAAGAANTVNNLQFNEDGDRVYYIDKVSMQVKVLNVETDENGNVQLSDGGAIIEGKNVNSFNGLDLGGASAGSRTTFVVHEGGMHIQDYESADIRLYGLGLTNTHIDTLADANQAILDLNEASNRLNAERAKVRAKATRFDHMLNGHRAYISNMQTAESQIRDIDVARESTTFSSLQVKHQAAAAILAQHHQISRSVLTLLQG